MEFNTQKVTLLCLLLFLCCILTCLGTHGVFLNRPEASRVLLHRTRRANSFFEEFKLGDLERECLEEKCSYEEAREIFSFPENLEEFWRNYAEEDQCESGPCKNGATCVDQVKNYICVCLRGFEGRDCHTAVQESFGCLYKNGGCEHFCTDAPGSPPRCECAPGYTLGEDNTSCQPEVPFPCGRVVQFNPRIVKGNMCPKGECPWQAMLEYEKTYMCGGIILDAGWVLTAAHCVWRVQVSQLQVTVGEHIRFKPEGTEQVRRVVRVIVHPNYNHSSADSDLALLRLDSKIALGLYALPVCLPPRDRRFVQQTLAAVRSSVVSGWGRLAQGGLESVSLQRLEVPLVPLQDCREQTGLNITDNMLCAGFPEGGQDSCQGDSGGPLVTRYKNTWFLTGVVSWGKGCAQSGFYGIYTRVSNFLDWINNTMATV
ncbi:coagulation factor VII [Megalops cyprinoides]|uniref:coagulation factor VII n=1 Tax=Megalops cyprinoides TaxID=118141 RepID=UPI0018641F11|nr:coagulation factor VII [Megalops cyprinoides]